MPYKIGFQPAGVKVDKSEEYIEARRRSAEEREKEEGRLGRRWAKVGAPFHTSYQGPSC
jgi:rabenosyn-5